MNRETLRTADDLLRDYVEETLACASAASPRMTVHAGYVTALFCESTRRCAGSPRFDHSDHRWKCTGCRKFWAMERIELPKGALGGRVIAHAHTGRPKLTSSRPQMRGASESRLHNPARARFGAILDQVFGLHPIESACWRLHVLDPSPVLRDRAREPRNRRGVVTIGLPLDEIPDRIREYVQADMLPTPEHDLTLYRIREYLETARGAVMRRVLTQGL